MGAYSYCHKCEAGMDAPTIREAIMSAHACPQCGHEHHVEDWKRADVLEGLEQRLTTIEQHLGLNR